MSAVAAFLLVWPIALIGGGSQTIDLRDTSRVAANVFYDLLSIRLQRRSLTDTLNLVYPPGRTMVIRPLLCWGFAAEASPDHPKWLPKSVHSLTHKFFSGNSAIKKEFYYDVEPDPDHGKQTYRINCYGFGHPSTWDDGRAFVAFNVEEQNAKERLNYDLLDVMGLTANDAIHHNEVFIEVVTSGNKSLLFQVLIFIDTLVPLDYDGQMMSIAGKCINVKVMATNPKETITPAELQEAIDLFERMQDDDSDWETRRQFVWEELTVQ